MQKPATCPYPEAPKYSPRTTILAYFLKINFNI